MARSSSLFTRLIPLGDLSTFALAHVDLPEAGKPIVK